MTQIKGYQSLDKKLKNIRKSIQPTMNISVGKQVQHVRGVAVKRCPAKEGELRRSIVGAVKKKKNSVRGVVYTNKSYAPYVEFGTGPTGEKKHKKVSPEVNVTYSQKGWSYKDDDGKWIYTNGQAAQPFMYPALKSQEKRVTRNIKKDFKKAMQEIAK